jgi:hypothetical protein
VRPTAGVHTGAGGEGHGDVPEEQHHPGIDREFLEVSQPTISRTIAALSPVIADVLAPYVPDAGQATDGRVALVDGTLTPCWNWAPALDPAVRQAQDTGHNHQVATDLTGRLLHVPDPLPGKTHDARAITDTGLAQIIDLSNAIGDKDTSAPDCSRHTGNRPAGNSCSGRRNSTEPSTLCAPPVERAIANLKTRRILHIDYRSLLNAYPTAFATTRTPLLQTGL